MGDASDVMEYDRGNTEMSNALLHMIKRHHQYRDVAISLYKSPKIQTSDLPAPLSFGASSI